MVTLCTNLPPLLATSLFPSPEAEMGWDAMSALFSAPTDLLFYLHIISCPMMWAPTHLLSHSFQELSYFHPHSSCFSHYHSQKLWISTFLSAPHHFPAQLSHQSLHPASPFLSTRIIIAPHDIRGRLFSILPFHITSMPEVALSETPRVTISVF